MRLLLTSDFGVPILLLHMKLIQSVKTCNASGLSCCLFRIGYLVAGLQLLGATFCFTVLPCPISPCFTLSYLQKSNHYFCNALISVKVHSAICRTRGYSVHNESNSDTHPTSDSLYIMYYMCVCVFQSTAVPFR